MNKGFTLAEILVVMAITAIIGTILVVIFTNTLRGSNKSQMLSVIKQNGQAVLENLDKTIRSADDAVCSASFFPGRTLVISQDGVYTRYRIVFRDDVVGTAPSSCIGSEKNGCIIQDNPVKQQDPDTDKLETDSAFVLRACNSNDPMSSAQVLTDTNLQTGVWVKSGSFNVSRSAGHKATVTVNFTLKPGAGAPSVVAGQIDDVAFQTTIGLR